MIEMIGRDVVCDLGYASLIQLFFSDGTSYTRWFYY